MTEQGDHTQGGQIKFIREAAGMTQVDLAMKLGVTVVTVSRWENNKSLPHSVFIKQIKGLEKKK